MVMGVFAPAVPPIPPTPQRVLDAAVSSQAEAMFVVPSFCEVRKALLSVSFLFSYDILDMVFR